MTQCRVCRVVLSPVRRALGNRLCRVCDLMEVRQQIDKKNTEDLKAEYVFYSGVFLMFGFMLGVLGAVTEHLFSMYMFLGWGFVALSGWFMGVSMSNSSFMEDENV